MEGLTDGRTDGRTEGAILICLPKFLWGHKKFSFLRGGGGGGGVRGAGVSELFYNESKF